MRISNKLREIKREEAQVKNIEIIQNMKKEFTSEEFEIMINGMNHLHQLLDEKIKIHPLTKKHRANYIEALTHHQLNQALKSVLKLRTFYNK